MRFKTGVNRDVKPETAYWMGVVEAEWKEWFDEPFTITSAYRPGPGAHGRKEGFDVRRPRILVLPSGERDNAEHFCKSIQQKYGRFIGVQLEPEWGKGKKYTAPHIHFQLKGPARWKHARHA